ncbi:hypothetical protein MNBD_GAMMA17-2233 [hydrothermal vent metagenome]|uniref:Bacterial OB-fold domain-containing protein n=1 Tax=hydrothermal vent metagenome TaxID=652676 RepID=A0A3B0ZC29_9ZZZZ
MRLYKKAALAVLLMLGFGFAHAGDATKTVEAVNLEKIALSGQTVIIQGHVTKVNNGIMKRNFIHLEDGTGSGDTAHLIITSTETAKVGDNVTITGTVALDTDFGFGYLYPLLVEKATIKQANAKAASHAKSHDH